MSSRKIAHAALWLRVRQCTADKLRLKICCLLSDEIIIICSVLHIFMCEYITFISIDAA